MRALVDAQPDRTLAELREALHSSASLSSVWSALDRLQLTVKNIQTAREESERRGFAGGVTYYCGDFLERADTIPRADIVTLDRVINVYPDWKRLIAVSAGRARR